MTLAAVMPLPEGLPELAFAGALGRRRVRMIHRPGESPLFADADFCITARSIRNAACLKARSATTSAITASRTNSRTQRRARYHRKTRFGRSPSSVGAAGRHQFWRDHPRTDRPVIPTVVGGVHAIHAVDAAGVHPLLLAIGSERYVPYATVRKPQELLTIATRFWPGSIVARQVPVHRRERRQSRVGHSRRDRVLRHILEGDCGPIYISRPSTIDTLDYSGTGLNEGSKAGGRCGWPPRRSLAASCPPT